MGRKGRGMQHYCIIAVLQHYNIADGTISLLSTVVSPLSRRLGIHSDKCSFHLISSSRIHLFIRYSPDTHISHLPAVNYSFFPPFPFLLIPLQSVITLALISPDKIKKSKNIKKHKTHHPPHVLSTSSILQLPPIPPPPHPTISRKSKYHPRSLRSALGTLCSVRRLSRSSSSWLLAPLPMRRIWSRETSHRRRRRRG